MSRTRPLLRGRRRRGLRRRVEAVVAAGNCSGCGACAALSGAIEMHLDDQGHVRPRWWPGVARSPRTDQLEANAFAAVCPGVVVRRFASPEASGSDPVLGSFVSAWTGWAADPRTRWEGSSGGVLTALSQWLLETGQATAVVGATMSPSARTRTIPVRVTRPEEVPATAGSRYAPVATGSLFRADAVDEGFIGKPCEVAAARSLADRRAGATQAPALLMSFFCAGVPSQHATEALVARTGVDPDPDGQVRYRGRGWPGRFVVDDGHGAEASLSYEESWGDHLGRQIQTRCKICPDGLGGHADIAVGDYWVANADGYPAFGDLPGRSVVLARTLRGHDLLMRASAEGVVVLEPVRLADVTNVQPLQRDRRETLPGRLLGRRLAGRPVPSYPGFGLTSVALRRPILTLRAARGSFDRARRQQRVTRTSAKGRG